MLKKITSFIIIFSLLFQQTGFAQIAGQIDISNQLGNLVNTFKQDKFHPLHFRYLSYDQVDNNFKLLLDKGDIKNPQSKILEDTTSQLLNYFFIGISLPNDVFWVNLNPDSPKEMIDQNLAKTDLGKILLEADVQLKKDTAKYTSPLTAQGKEYWDKLYAKAENIYGNDNVIIPTLIRPWIVPDEIIVRESGGSAYIYKATLKVMLEEDYLKNDKVYNFQDERSKRLNEYSAQLVREKIIPQLTREINSSHRYAALRQVYYSLILAQWFKAKYKSASRQATMSQVDRIDKGDLTGLTSKKSWSKEAYYQTYQKSFKEGEYNIKEPRYTANGNVIRKYFSGGIILGRLNEVIQPHIIYSKLKGYFSPEFWGQHYSAAVSSTGQIRIGLTTYMQSAKSIQHEDGGKIVKARYNNTVGSLGAIEVFDKDNFSLAYIIPAHTKSISYRYQKIIFVDSKSDLNDYDLLEEIARIGVYGQLGGKIDLDSIKKEKLDVLLYDNIVVINDRLLGLDANNQVTWITVTSNITDLVKKIKKNINALYKYPKHVQEDFRAITEQARNFYDKTTIEREKMRREEKNLQRKLTIPQGLHTLNSAYFNKPAAIEGEKKTGQTSLSDFTKKSDDGGKDGWQQLQNELYKRKFIIGAYLRVQGINNGKDLFYEYNRYDYINSNNLPAERFLNIVLSAEQMKRDLQFIRSGEFLEGEIKIPAPELRRNGFYTGYAVSNKFGFIILSSVDSPGEISYAKYILQALAKQEESKDNKKDDGGNGKGGIDFSVLPIISQPANMVLQPGVSPLGLINIEDLDSEWLQIEKMASNGIIPSGQRMQRFFNACYYNGQLSKFTVNILSCIAGIMRLEEDRAKTSDPILKDIVVLLETDSFETVTTIK